MRIKTWVYLAAAAAMTAYGADYNIDPAHSAAQFSVRHLMVSNVRGQFTKVSGTVSYDAAHPEATRISATIDVNSIDTREPNRDQHLKSGDFFDAAKYPTMTFQSRSAQKTAQGLDVSGELTIHGVTRKVVLHVSAITPEIKDPWGLMRRGATATTVINRQDYGLKWNQTLDSGGLAVGDEVTITIDAEITRKP